ncbi:uncharacterized protein [Dendropsophus ebraccatus]|uniref:uncharacterized protein n=1 Tax=Dendropsophus ebraccatus TaxID=150705 RepID=UPI003831BD0D
MKPVFCAVLLAIILRPAECRPYGQGHGDGDEGDYGPPPGGRRGRGNQNAQGDILGQLGGLAEKFGLGGGGGGLGGLGDIAQKVLGSGNGQCPLAGLAEKFGLSGLLGGGGGNKGSLLGGLMDKFGGKGQKPSGGRSGGRSGGQRGGKRKKGGSYGQEAESDYGGGQEDYGRAGRNGYGGGRQGRPSGYRRQNEDYEDN